MADKAAARSHPQPTPKRDIVVIGASAGGVAVLLDLAADLPEDFPAAVLVVLHVGAHRSVLPELMASRGAKRALHAIDGQPLHHGTILVAPSDQHMLVQGGTIRLQRGPKENHARPAIDPLFRSAALAHGPRVIGVVLSGRLDDGTAGLQAIKRCGGLAVIQDPADAEQPEMPVSALAHVDIDHCVPAANLVETLMRLVGTPVAAAPPAPAAPSVFASEQAISDGEDNPMDHLYQIGQPSRFACPECSGVLWEINDTQPRRYRCHTGHAYTLRTLAFAQDESADEALWAAMRALQEREALLRALAESGDSDADGRQGQDLSAQAEQTGKHSDQLRRMIASG
ncbi:MAG: protein-glutamate methylesterase (protein methylesterase)-like protein [Xanthomonadaceae bacterium]|nr:protein-glutamate methylesterase (protein methylesterase)-like protein [Xanthomonadaceae bacterium]